MVSEVNPETIKLLGGALCLDFANSVDWSAHGEPIRDEALTEPGALARWGRRMGLDGPDSNAAELSAALELRAALHATFSAIAREEEPPADALDLLAVDHAEAAAAGHLVARDGAWRLEWPADEPRRVRFAVVTDALALLADPARLARVARCPGRDCGWLFLDKSGRRHWCSMQTCGSRAKMRRMYARRRAAEGLAGRRALPVDGA
jgi:predicted RNA-binding Zn ribbon-like protein